MRDTPIQTIKYLFSFINSVFIIVTISLTPFLIKIDRQNPDQVFKTLVARGKSGGFHVFVIPVAKELDLKKAAKAAGEKSVEMVHVKELLGLTGYVRGGCSPVGMKKAFPTVFDESVNNVPTVMVSAGKIGFQIECAPADLIKLTRAATAHITTD